MSKTQQVKELLEQGKSPNEIKEQVGCSLPLITKCKQALAKSNVQPPEETVTEEEDSDFNKYSEAGGFIKKVALEPDPELDTSRAAEKKKYDVECGACGYQWSTESGAHIDECPSCGVDLT